MLMNFVLDLPIEKTVIMVYLFFVILLFVRPILIFIENKKKLADNLDKSELRRRKSWSWSLWCAKLLSAQLMETIDAQKLIKFETVSTQVFFLLKKKNSTW